MQYDAFISYSTSGDAAVARQLQHDLERLVKPWYRRRPFLRIFRDETGLAPGSDLDGRLTERLEQTGHLVLLLSPESARAYWVDLEVRHWLDRYGPDTIVPVITAWSGGVDTNLSGFAWDGDDVPTSLRGALGTPLGVDLRWARGAEPGELHLGNQRWEQNVAQIAAAIRDEPPDEFFGALAAMRARARVLTGTIGLAVALLLGAIAVAGILLLLARGEVSDARAELGRINATLETREGELDAATAELATAQAAVDARQRELDGAEERLRAVESDLTATENELADARDDVAAATVAVGEAERLRDEAEQARLDAQAQRDQAAIDLAAAQYDLADAQDAATTARRLADEAEEATRRATDQADAAERARAAAAIEEEAVALAIDASAATDAGDAALGLVLAVESALTKEPPSAASLSALIAARTGMVANRWQPLPAGDVSIGSGPVTAGSVRPVEAFDGATVVDVVTRSDGRLLVEWSDGVVWLTSPDGSSSTFVHAKASRFDSLFLARDGSVIVEALIDTDRYPYTTTLVRRDPVTGESLGAAVLPAGLFVDDVVAAETGAIVIATGETEEWDADSGTWSTVPGAGIRRWDFADPTGWSPQVALVDPTSYRLLIESDLRAAGAWLELHVDGDEATSITFRSDDGRRIEIDGGTGGLPYCAVLSPDGSSVHLVSREGSLRVVDLVRRTISSGPAFPPTELTDEIYGGPTAIPRDCSGFVGFSDRGAPVTVSSSGTLQQWGTNGESAGREVFRLGAEVSQGVLDPDRDRVHLVTAAGGVIDVERRDPQPVRPVRSTVLDGGGVFAEIDPSAGRIVVLSGTQADVYDPTNLERVVGVYGRSGIGPVSATSNGEFIVMHESGYVLNRLDEPLPTAVRLPWEQASLATGTPVIVGLGNGVVDIARIVSLDVAPRVERTFAIPAQVADAYRSAIAPDGSTVALSGSAGSVVLDTATGEVVVDTTAATPGSVPRTVFDPTGSLFVEYWASTARVWRLRDATLAFELEHDRDLGDIAMSADGSLLAADGGRVIWDLRSGSRLSGQAVELDLVTGVSFVGTSRRLAVTGVLDGEHQLTIWDTLELDAACRLASPYMTGRTVGTYLRGDRVPVACL